MEEEDKEEEEKEVKEEEDVQTNDHWRLSTPRGAT
jgi:hypothetical protein